MLKEGSGVHLSIRGVVHGVKMVRQLKYPGGKRPTLSVRAYQNVEATVRSVSPSMHFTTPFREP